MAVKFQCTPNQETYVDVVSNQASICGVGQSVHDLMVSIAEAEAGQDKRF